MAMTWSWRGRTRPGHGTWTWRGPVRCGTWLLCDERSPGPCRARSVAPIGGTTMAQYTLDT
eukprot:15484264-Alexandrium_andersonii.AAC.1